MDFNLDKIAQTVGLAWYFPHDRVVLQGTRISTLYGTVPVPEYSRFNIRDSCHVSIADASKADARVVALLRPYMVTGED